MLLGVKETAALLNVSEKTIYRWIKQEKIPAYRFHDQYRFNRVELMEWATAAKIPVSTDILSEPAEPAVELPSLASALQTGGIFYRIEGRDKPAVIANMVEHMRLGDEMDREFFLQALMAREELGSTGIGDGIAIPHVRNPLILHAGGPSLTLCFLENPVEFGALDGLPVHTVFALVAPSVRIHLHLLARLAYLLKTPSFREILEHQGSREEILAEAQRLEQALPAPSTTATPR